MTFSATDLTGLTLSAMRDGLRAGDFSARELTEAHITAVTAARPLNLFLCETFDQARAQADIADAERASGTARPLSGIPIGIKDLFATKGVTTTAGSRILEGFVPPYESTVTARLQADGAVMLGKLNLDEFAMGSTCENSGFGPSLSPWRLGETNLTPGGSSGGSSAAVAAQICAGAVGSDTGGSIRQPAAFTGTVGMKPTYGRCSRWGMIAFASSLDQAGPMARSVRDCAILLRSMAGFDPGDSTSLDLEVPDYEAGLDGDLRGVRVGIPGEYLLDGLDEDVVRTWRAAQDWVRDAGGETVEISLPHTLYALPAYYVIAPAEASSNLARYDGVRYGRRVWREGMSLLDMYEETRAQGFGPEVKRRIMIGTHVLSAGYHDAYYLQAQKTRTLIIRDFDRAWETCDMILTPTTPSAAFPIGQKCDDPTRVYFNDVFSVPASLAGLPAISVPAGLNRDGLPLGVQIIGRARDEMGVLQAGQALERAAAFSARPQRWW